MRAFLRATYTVSTGTALGAMVFFTFIVAQAVFSTLPIDTAGHVLARIFSPYYTLTALLCVVSFASSFGAYGTNPARLVRVSQALIALAAASSLVGWLALLPAMNRIRLQIPTFAGPSTPLINQFFMLHGISMLLNLVCIVILLFCLIVFAAIRRTD